MLDYGVSKINSLHDGAIITPHIFVSEKRSELTQHISCYAPSK